MTRDVALVIGIATSAMSVAFGAAAFAVDGLVPTPNYDPSCSEGQPGAGGVCQTDNRTVTYYADSQGTFELEEPDRDVLRTTIAEDYRPGVLDITYDATPVFSGDAETDWIYQEGSVPDPYDGYTWCDDDLAGYKCDQHYIRIKGGGYYTPYLTCHETGHAAGLVHGQSTSPRYPNSDPFMGCMRLGGGSSDIQLWQRDDINDTY